MELTHDLPLEGLVSEEKAIKDSIQMLEDKLDNARYSNCHFQRIDLREEKMGYSYTSARGIMAIFLPEGTSRPPKGRRA